MEPQQTLKFVSEKQVNFFLLLMIVQQFLVRFILSASTDIFILYIFRH